jgi:hypothetical protein
VVVNNDFGSVTSAGALLGVIPSITITTIGVDNLLQRRPERVDELVRQPPDEPDSVG